MTRHYHHYPSFNLSLISFVSQVQPSFSPFFSLPISSSFLLHLPLFQSPSSPSMSTPLPSVLNVLVVGTGNLGGPILNTLTSDPFKSRIRTFLLVRPSALSDPSRKASFDQLKSQQVTLLEGDLEHGEAKLTELLKSNSIYGIISTVSGHLIALQHTLIEAAKTSGTVRHFIPSEFGMDTAAAKAEGPLAHYITSKHRIHDDLKSSGLIYTFILVTALHHFLTDTPFFGVDVAHRTINAPGSLDTQLSTANVDDVAWVVANSFFDSKAYNTSLYLGEPISYGRIAEILESATGVKFEKKVVTKAELEQTAKANPGNVVGFAASFALGLIKGEGTFWPAEKGFLAQKGSERKPITFEEFAKKRFENGL